MQVPANGKFNSLIQHIPVLKRRKPMGYCTRCGKPLKPREKFCPSCGAATPTKQPAPSVPISQPRLGQRKERTIKNPNVPKSPTGKVTDRAYRRPVAFRVVACILIAALSISAALKLSKTPPGVIPSPAISDKTTLPTKNVPIGNLPVYTAEEFARAPAEKAPVSPEVCVATLGSVVVNFDTWNLSGEDEVVVKRLPQKSVAELGTTISGYDLSLGSGQSEFLTSVAVTIPNTTSKDEEGSVMFFDEDTATWEFVSHDLSEDGKSYTVYMPHFSVIAEKKVKKYIGTENDIRSTSDLDTQGSLYQYMSFTSLDGSTIPLESRNVYLSEQNFRKLFSSIETDELIKLLKRAELPSQDALAFALGTLNNAHSLAEGAVLLGRLDAALSAAAKIRLDGSMAGFGTLLTVGRIAYQANKGGSFAAILLENKYNILEGLLGGLAYGASYVGATAASTLFSVAAIAVFAWSLATGFIESATEYESLEEQAYRFFLDLKKPRFSMSTLQVGRNGDFELGINGENFAKALKAIYSAYEDKPKELDAAVSQFYNDFAYLFWNGLTEAERDEFCYREYQNSPFSRYEWHDPSRETIDRYAQKVIARAVSESEPILRAFARDALADMYNKLYNTLKRDVEPYLNEKLTLIVKDKGLTDKETFDDSPYAAHEIRFADKTAPQFTPRFVDPAAYTDEKLNPRIRKDSDIIFECTMYHYIMMGCPTSLTFAGEPDEDLPEVTIDFTVDSKDIYVEIERTKKTAAPIRSFSAVKEPELKEWQNSADYVLIRMALRSAGEIRVNPVKEDLYTFTIPAFSNSYTSLIEIAGSDPADNTYTLTSTAAVFEGTLLDNGALMFKLVSGGDVTIKNVDRLRDKTSLWQSKNTACTIMLYPKYGDEGALLRYSLGYDEFDSYYGDSSIHSVDEGEEKISVTGGKP